MRRRKTKDKNLSKQNFAEVDQKPAEKITSAGKTENPTKAAEEKKTVEQKVLTPEQIEREFVDILNYQRKQRDNLLGNFTSGRYQISDAIREQLLQVPKKFEVFEDNLVRAATILGRFVLNFKVVFEIDPDICNAKLFLVEIEHDIDEDIKHETLLDEIEQARTVDFRRIVFEKWHIFFDGEVFAKDSLLEHYLHMQAEENLFVGELVGILSQLYIVRMLALLDKMGEVGEKIRIDFRLAMEKFLAKDPKLVQDYAFQKRLLDKFILKHDALVLIASNEEGAKILQGYSTPLKNVRDKTYPSITETPKKTEKKEEKKAVAKPAVKKKSSPAKSSGWKPVNVDITKLFSAQTTKEPVKIEEKQPPIPSLMSMMPPAQKETSRPQSVPRKAPQKSAELSEEDELAAILNELGDMDKKIAQQTEDKAVQNGKINSEQRIENEVGNSQIKGGKEDAFSISDKQQNGRKIEKEQNRQINL